MKQSTASTTLVALAITALASACSGIRTEPPANLDLPLGARLVALAPTDEGLVGTVVLPRGTPSGRLEVTVDGRVVPLELLPQSHSRRLPSRARFVLER
jgi:hypothetical protein